MRILVVSDIHGNQAALDAVLAEPHDLLVCLGDVVGYGPEPGACWRRIRASGGLLLKGNHDHALGTGAPPRCRANFRHLAEATAGIGREQCSMEERAALASLPSHAVGDVEGVSAYFVHATPSDPLYRYLEPDPAAWASEVLPIAADLVIVGHTHIQFRIEAAGRTIVNPGSVGQPKDGDPRAAYALIENGRIDVRRVEYPVERTVTALRDHGLAEGVLEPLSILLRTGRAPS